MRWVKRIFLGLLGLIVFIGLAAYIFLWLRPVGINNYVNKSTVQLAVDSPEILTYIGAIDNTIFDFHSGKLAKYTKEQEEKSLAKVRKARKGLDKYGPEGLEGQKLLSWKTMAWFMDDIIIDAEFEYSGYPVNQLSGPFVNMPQFLTDTHAIKNKKSIERYLSRLNEFSRVIGEMHVNVQDHRDNGVIPPDFIIEKTVVGLKSFIEDGAEKNPLVATLPDRLDKVDGLTEEQKQDYIDRATEIVSEKIIPGYEKMISLQEDLLKSATSDAGIWKIKDGDEIYKAALRSNTTTDLSADEIHNIGLAEVARISKAMDVILRGQGMIEGTVTERVQALMKDPEQLYPNTDEGRKAMRDELVAINDKLMEKAGDFFITLPPQKLEILRVPEYSQDSSPGGYYSGPSMDGKRPGRFYINQKDTADNPKWTLPTLLYHEAAPGHHFQISRGMLVEGVPFIRKMGLFNAYTEGWALYAEKMAAEDMGMYDNDPLGDLGRLQAEMFRAVRLVVDTGLHHKRWTREQAIDYMSSNTGMSDDEVEREIERYVVWPGQATAYKTGQLKIVQLREKAEAALGDDFNLRDFNEMILENGALPLEILGGVVDEWLAEKAG